ncbi:tetratricopeptide repeat protein [Methylomagnum sp.]
MIAPQLLIAPLTVILLSLGLFGCEPQHRPFRQSDTLADHSPAHHHTEAFRPPAGSGPTTPTAADEPAELLPGLGALHYPITTAAPLAQAYFDQGLRLTYAFNHAEARRAFRQAQRLDPACALCFWGEALALGPNINAPMESAALGPALDAIGKARALSGQAAPRERALIEALAKRYSPDTRAERAALDRAYADAMGEAAARFPADDQIAVLYAESLMDLSPWDYWEAGGAKPKGRMAESLAVLERVLRRNPEHPGAIHYYIHAVEASDRPARAEAHADRLGALMPGAGHLVHMPAHVYYRVGRYQDSIEANRRAVAADEAYFAKVGQRAGLYADGYYPHNVHFLMTSAQMAGDGATAIEAARKLAALVDDRAAETAPWIQPIKAAPFFAHAQFGTPDAILALPDPGDRLPYVKAAWHYARGVAGTTAGDADRAEREANAIARLREGADWSALVAAGVPAGDVLDIAERVLRARLAQARGDLDAARAQLESAAAVQDRLPYMEPPFWYYPVRQTLGAACLQSGDLAGAEAAFQAVLEKSPHNAWALWGLREVHARRGDAGQVRAMERRLGKAWLGEGKGPALGRL